MQNVRTNFYIRSFVNDRCQFEQREWHFSGKNESGKIRTMRNLFVESDKKKKHDARAVANINKIYGSIYSEGGTTIDRKENLNDSNISKTHSMHL